MKYKFSKDPLFGKYCYIDTPWIAGKNTIYRIVNSGVRSNAWVEVPIRGRAEVVTHDHYEDVVYVVLDTLIDEDSRIKKVALKDIVIADTPQTCFNCDHYEPKGWCNLFEDTVSPNYKCCSKFAEIKPCECEIKALHKEYQEPYCEVTDTPQTDSEMPKNALRSACTGCRFVGIYDTQFPCKNCVRKNKDYYDSEYMEGSR